MPRKLQIKRGLETNRSTQTPAAGELILTTDEHKLYVGDGSTVGGIPVAANFRSIEWEFTSALNQTAYLASSSTASKVAFPTSGGVFLVFYGSSKLKKTDYTITSTTLTLKSAPLEAGHAITVVYVGV